AMRATSQAFAVLLCVWLGVALRLVHVVSCRQIAAARHPRQGPYDSGATAMHGHWRRRSSTRAAKRIGWFIEVLPLGAIRPLEQVACVITHAECAGVSGPRYYAAGPGADVLGRLRKGKAVLCVPGLYVDVAQETAGLCRM